MLCISPLDGLDMSHVKRDFLAHESSTGLTPFLRPAMTQITVRIKHGSASGHFIAVTTELVKKSNKYLISL